MVNILLLWKEYSNMTLEYFLPEIMETSDERAKESLPRTGPQESPESVQLFESAGTSRTTTRGSLRFGTLSHHSFFSRHNPHPHRVRHLQGETLRTHGPVLLEHSRMCLCLFLICLVNLLFKFRRENAVNYRKWFLRNAVENVTPKQIFLQICAICLFSVCAKKKLHLYIVLAV